MNPINIRIALVEDDERFRTNLKKYFELTDPFEVIFTADSVESGLIQLEAHDDLDIVLLDIGLPGMSGLEGIPLFKKVKPELDVVILTSYEEEQKILKALCSGATSYISKRTRLEEIASALHIVHSGGSFMSPSIAREIVTYFAKGQNKEKKKILTSRQTEIMELMIEGNTYSSIAQALLISAETVKSHIKQIYTNLHVNNKAQAIAKYMAN